MKGKKCPVIWASRIQKKSDLALHLHERDQHGFSGMLIAGYSYSYRAHLQLALLRHRRIALRSVHACWWWSKMVFIRPPLIILILFNYLISCFHLKRCFWFAWWPQPAFNLDIERSCDCYDSANRRFRSWKALQTFSAHKF